MYFLSQYYFFFPPIWEEKMGENITHLIFFPVHFHSNQTIEIYIFFSLFSFHHFPSKNFTHLIFFPLPFHSSQTIEIYIFLSLFLSPFSNPLPSSFETKGNTGRRAQHRGGIRSQTRISSPLNLIYDVNNIHFVFII